MCSIPATPGTTWAAVTDQAQKMEMFAKLEDTWAQQVEPCFLFVWCRQRKRWTAAVQLTGNQKIHPGLSGPPGPAADPFFHALRRTKVTLNLIPSTLYGSNQCQILESKESCDRKQNVVEVREEFHGDTKVPVTVTVQMWRTFSRRNLSASTVGIFCKLPSTTINHHLFSLCLMLFVQKIVSCGYSVNQSE